DIRYESLEAAVVADLLCKLVAIRHDETLGIGIRVGINLDGPLFAVEVGIAAACYDRPGADAGSGKAEFPGVASVVEEPGFDGFAAFGVDESGGGFEVKRISRPGRIVET